MDGLEVEEACALEFPDLHGKLKAYKGDIRYDVYEREYIRIDSAPQKAVHFADKPAAVDSQEAKSHENEAESGVKNSKAGTHDPNPARCIYKSVYDEDLEHPDGSFSVHLTRHRQRCLNRMMRRG